MMRFARLVLLSLILLPVACAIADAQDSLYQHLPVRYALGEWRQDTTRAFCITRYYENGGLLDLIEVVPADSTSCRRDDGTVTPVFLDTHVCPGPLAESRPYPFLLVRCGPDQFRMVRRRELKTQ